MVRAIEQEQEIYRSRVFHHKGMREATGLHARTMSVDHPNGDWSLHRTNDKVAKSRLSREDGKDKHPSGEFWRLGLLFSRKDSRIRFAP